MNSIQTCKASQQPLGLCDPSHRRCYIELSIQGSPYLATAAVEE
jgi:hypothetical protein